MPVRTAFARGRCVVVPSRAESLPYIVLEAAAAQMPLIATDVGGIPEIVEGTNVPLVRPGDIAGLAGQMRDFLANPKPFLGRAIALQKQVAQRLHRRAHDERGHRLLFRGARRRSGARRRRAAYGLLTL